MRPLRIIRPEAIACSAYAHRRPQDFFQGWEMRKEEVPAGSRGSSLVRIWERNLRN